MSLTRAELSHTFFEGYLYLPRIFHLRTNMSETIKNITDEIGHLIAALNALGIVMMEVIVLTGLTIFLLYINFKIALISFILLLLFSTHSFASLLEKTLICKDTYEDDLDKSYSYK